MNILSLFDGMSCGRIALERAGLPVTKYYASEVDKHAIKVSKANWPDITHLGDVTKWREWDIDWSSINLLIGGSPCQGFSSAGKRLAFDDPRSALFFVYVDILNHIRSVNPDVKFMLENVKMKKEHMDVISEYLGAQPVFINSALVSAQNRQRYYWANWRIEQPEDKGVNLLDIIEIDSELPLFSTENNSRIAGISEDERGYRPYQNDKRKSGLSEIGRICKQDAKSDALTTNHRPKVMVAINGCAITYRSLSCIECERLQTVPEGYTAHVSNTQRYKMLGNGWTVDVIAHIFRQMTTHPTTCADD